LTDLVKKYIEQAGINKPGACHIFRHTMATLMLDNGADIRFIQGMLGHSQLSTTEIYTQVSIRKLKEVHTLTHPARIKPDQDQDQDQKPDFD
jgi:integrase/recombinase XerD